MRRFPLDVSLDSAFNFDFLFNLPVELWQDVFSLDDELRLLLAISSMWSHDSCNSNELESRGSNTDLSSVVEVGQLWEVERLKHKKEIHQNVTDISEQVSQHSLIRFFMLVWTSMCNSFNFTNIGWYQAKLTDSL